MAVRHRKGAASIRASDTEVESATSLAWRLSTFGLLVWIASMLEFIKVFGDVLLNPFGLVDQELQTLGLLTQHGFGVTGNRWRRWFWGHTAGVSRIGYSRSAAVANKFNDAVSYGCGLYDVPHIWPHLGQYQWITNSVTIIACTSGEPHLMQIGGVETVVVGGLDTLVGADLRSLTGRYQLLWWK